ncbi:hypothetical protein HDV05_007288 [Chytridiales sp. JEL 0842]|nr:hypothetical protein HDV05_007288 [Chytridiales sp. JEL 0842]
MTILNHFELLRSVGKGAFGKVRVVQHKQTGVNYALKYINKDKCIKMKAVENIIEERKLLEQLHSPFICNLRYAFQDDENMFMVLDLMLGGDLRFHLDRAQSLKEDQVHFYACEISLGLIYLHERNIVHRDLKPDNILLDEFGHATITDFNIAVRFREDKPLTAVAGSMAYMAPEVLSKAGYFSAVDWWSLGVVLYELLFGKRPFRGSTNDELQASIINDSLSLPPEYKDMSPGCIEALRGFINRDIKKRLGAKEGAGFEGLKSHKWFEKVDWGKVERREVTPPFVPDSKRANFDATHELEELLLEDNPLKAKPKKKKKEGEADSTLKVNDPNPELTAILDLMERKFTVFDFTKPRKESIAPGNTEGMKTGLSGSADGGEGEKDKKEEMVEKEKEKDVEVVESGKGADGS